jgi:glycosyltransferase involved in cell wall biosynthesis
MNVCMMVANPVVFDGRVLRHAEALALAGHRVTVLGVVGPNDTAQQPNTGTLFAIRRVSRQKRGLGPRVVWAESALRQRCAARLAAWLPSVWLEQVPALAVLADLAVATSAVELAWLGLAQPFDVFHGNDLNTLPAVAWAAKLRNKPFVYDAHEFYVEESPALSEAEKRARRLVEGRWARQASCVLTVNDLLAEKLQDLYPTLSPVVVRNVPPFLDVPDPAALPEGKPGTLKLLYHGTHVGLQQPGIGDVLAAMAKLKTKTHMTLVLRGQVSDAERGALHERADALGLVDRLVVAPPVSGPRRLIEEAQKDQAEVGLALHAPLPGNYALATPSKIYEYQMAGLAVCATSTPGNRLILSEDAGEFFPFGDVEKLTGLLARLAHDRNRLRAMRTQARARAQREFAWETEQQKLLTAYETLERQARRAKPLSGKKPQG